MYTCYAIDDDFSALDLIKDYVKLHSNLLLIKTFNDPLVALEDIQNRENVDLIFLDIEMPNIGGLELAQLLRHKTKKIVFTTGFDQYAIKSYDMGADDYLLKPFAFSRFVQTINRLFSNPVALPPNQKSKEIDYIFIRHADAKGMVSKVYYDDIVAFESHNNNVRVYTRTEDIWVYQKLSEFKLATENKGFIQIHRSYIVSKNFMKVIDRNMVILSNNLKFPIGRNYRSSVLKFISNNA